MSSRSVVRLGGLMGKHEWCEISDIAHDLLFCIDCGLLNVNPANQLPCPPWSSTGGGDTKTNRMHEAGEVEELKKIQELLLRSKDSHYVKPWDGVKYRDEAMILLQQLIQKHEGLSRG